MWLSQNLNMIKKKNPTGTKKYVSFQVGVDWYNTITDN